MEWTIFKKAPARWLSYVTRVNQHLTGKTDRFYVEAFTDPDAPAKIVTFLGTVSGRDGGLTASSKKTYVSAISSYLDVIGVDNSPYKELIKLYSNEVKNSGPAAAEECPVHGVNLLYAINSPKVHYHIKLMAGILLYGYRKTLHLIDVCNTRHDEDNGESNYLNMETGIWTIHKSNALPVRISVCAELLDIISSGMGPVWVMGQTKVSNTNTMSVMFKHMFKVSYMVAAKMIADNEDPSSSSSSDASSTSSSSTDESSAAKPKPVIKLKSEPASAPAPAPESTGTVRAATYEWSYFRRQDADDIHIQRIKQLMETLFENSDVFYHSNIDSEEGVAKVKSALSLMSSLNTQMNYANSLCKFLELTMAKHYTAFTLMRDQISLSLHEKNAEREVAPYNEIIPKLQTALASEKTSQDLKIMCKLLLSIRQYGEINVGALRFSDLVNTRIKDDGDHHYLDLINRVWTLRSGHTKNKQDRIATVSKEFVDYINTINTINTINPEKGLICSDTGKTHGISKEFLKHIGVNFTEVRASYVTYLDSVCKDVELIRTICNNQGHKLTTALESYRRTES